MHFYSLHYNKGNTVRCVASSLLMLTRHIKMHSYIQYHVNKFFSSVYSAVNTLHIRYRLDNLGNSFLLSNFQTDLGPTHPHNQ